MRRMLALIGVAAVLSLVLGYALGASAQERPVRILVNGKEIQCDPPAFIKGDRTFVPVRFVSEALGAVVDWDQEAFAVQVKWPPWYASPAELVSLREIANTPGLTGGSKPDEPFFTIERGATVVRFYPPAKAKAEVLVNGVMHDQIDVFWLPYATCFRRADLERFGLLPAER